MGRQQYAKLMGVFGLIMIMLSGCAETPAFIQRALGRDIAIQRDAMKDAHCPQITIFQVRPETVKCGDPVTLEVAASGQVPEKIFYTWDIEGQAFETGQRAIWSTPSGKSVEDPEKVYTVRGIVSDGECAVTQSIDVKVLCNYAFDEMVNFAFGKATLDATAKAHLDEIAQKLQQYPDHSVVIEGHTDYIGGERYNQSLGQKRADAVKHYLTAFWQIPASRIITRSYGESEPLASNTSEAGRAQNRRAEVFRVVLKTK